MLHVGWVLRGGMLQCQAMRHVASCPHAVIHFTVRVYADQSVGVRVATYESGWVVPSLFGISERILPLGSSYTHLAVGTARH